MHRLYTWLLAVLAPISVAGCILQDRATPFDSDLIHYKAVASLTPMPDADSIVAEVPADMTPPRTLRDPSAPENWWDLTLDEAVQLAITHSPVLRDLGGAVIRSPASVRTNLGPSIDASDPRQGMEAALAAFDANFSTGLFYEYNNRLLNNFFTSGGARTYKQDLVLYQTQLSKQAATGTQFFLRGNINYDSNNSAGNRFPFAYDTILETEVRHPVLQGTGLNFNRIAGPNATPGSFNGVMVARLNTDVSLIDFRMGLRDLMSNVENAYWDLYFAYRDLNAKIEARNRSLETWRAVYGMMESGQPGGEAEREAQFREQYYRFEEEVKNALTGRLVDRTATFNGSSGGTFRGESGVHVAERRLRMVMGLDINDGRLIRPIDEPSLAPVSYDWSELVTSSLVYREELSRQRLQIRRRELELTASRNYLLPRFDVVGRYRARGLGHYWAAGAETDPNDPQDQIFGHSSIDNLFGGGFHEWMVGGEFSFPVGYRRAYAAVRNAQLQLARERVVLEEQERQICHDLSNAVADVYRAYEVVQTNFNSRLAAKTQVDLLRDKLRQRLPVNLDQLIDAERRYSEADSRYQRALSEYMISQKNVQFERGTMLEYCQVGLAEYQDGCGGYLGAVRRSADGGQFTLLDYTLDKPVPPTAEQPPTVAPEPLPAPTPAPAPAPAVPMPSVPGVPAPEAPLPLPPAPVPPPSVPAPASGPAAPSASFSTPPVVPASEASLPPPSAAVPLHLGSTFAAEQAFSTMSASPASVVPAPGASLPRPVVHFGSPSEPAFSTTPTSPAPVVPAPATSLPPPPAPIPPSGAAPATEAFLMPPIQPQSVVRPASWLRPW
jgi:outer membrane protein TolC